MSYRSSRRREGHACQGIRFGLGFSDATPFDADETGAKAGRAAVIFVAARLVDPPLGPECGLNRFNRKAVRFNRAVPAALADQFVDEHAGRGILNAAPLAQTPLFGGAHLLIHDDADTGFVAQLALQSVQIVAMLDPSRLLSHGI